jgi:hypothetical protein
MTIDMRSFAQYGAKARLAELTNEMESIVSAFPELKPSGTTPRRQRVITFRRTDEVDGHR